MKTKNDNRWSLTRRRMFGLALGGTLVAGALLPLHLVADPTSRKNDEKTFRNEEVADGKAKDYGLMVLPAKVNTLDKLRLNTNEKVKLSDGEVNDRYVFKNPEEGHTFLNLTLHVASEHPFMLARKNVRLVEELDGGTVLEPVNWHIDSGEKKNLLGDSPAVPDSLAVGDKSIFEVIFEAPEKGRDKLVLYVDDVRVGSVEAMREATETRSSTD